MHLETIEQSKNSHFVDTLKSLTCVELHVKVFGCVGAQLFQHAFALYFVPGSQTRIHGFNCLAHVKANVRHGVFGQLDKNIGKALVQSLFVYFARQFVYEKNRMNADHEAFCSRKLAYFLCEYVLQPLLVECVTGERDYSFYGGLADRVNGVHKHADQH